MKKKYNNNKKRIQNILQYLVSYTNIFYSTWLRIITIPEPPAPPPPTKKTSSIGTSSVKVKVPLLNHQQYLLISQHNCKK